MLFSSFEFFIFLLATLVLYYLIPKKIRWVILLLGSCAFIFIAGRTYILYMLVTILSVYLCGLFMDKNFATQSKFLEEHKETLQKEDKISYKNKQKKTRTAIITVAIVLNLLILILVKYSNFILENIALLAPKSIGRESIFGFLVIPMGISFYTLQAIGYLVDVYRGTIQAEKNPFKLALFLTFFPLLVQGPISRYGELSKTLCEGNAFSWKNFFWGAQRILWGCFKKMVIADRLLPAVLTITGDSEKYAGGITALGMLLYTIELYADFTGGIDITIGVAEMFGVTVKENFNRPYFSCSLKEYWRRWHITMCEWFKDYVFYPVSSSGWMQKLSKFTRNKFGNKVGRKIPVYIASFLVWLSTGLWHGASWNFVVWGLCNFVILMVSEELEPLYKKLHDNWAFTGTKAYKLITMLRTFLLICALNLFDCYSSIGETVKAFISIFNFGKWNISGSGLINTLGLDGKDYLVVLCGVIVMLVFSIIQTKGSVREQLANKKYIVSAVTFSLLFISIIIFGAYGQGYDSGQFIYNRF